MDNLAFVNLLLLNCLGDLLSCLLSLLLLLASFLALFVLLASNLLPYRILREGFLVHLDYGGIFLHFLKNACFTLQHV